MVFDVTEGETPKRINGQLSGSDYIFSASNASICEYAMIDLSRASSIPEAEYIEKVSNQDLHSLSPKDMIIIVHPLLKKYAEQLAEIHYEDSGLETLIVNPEEIYNEFSSGKPDVTAYRRFLKMFYDRWKAGGEQSPQYVLLFGDGTYDQRYLLTDQLNWTDRDKKVILLSYQSRGSIEESSSYATDDYIGFLDDNEGNVNTMMSNSQLDIAVGRLPVRSDQEAANVVTKINKYISSDDRSIWRNNIVFTADDLVSYDNSVETEQNHTRDAESSANIVSSKYPDFIVTKIYEDTYQRVTSASGATVPDATRALLDKISSGTLVFSYLGHGSTASLSHENLLTRSAIESMTNSRLGLWVVATCDFGRYDYSEESSSEYTVFNPRGGAIAVISTARPVGIRNNGIITQAIMNNIFAKQNGKPLRMGDILRLTKESTSVRYVDERLKFVLLGDPALRLSFPSSDYRVSITEINGKPSTASDIQISALSNTIIKGKIVDSNGNIATNFSGELESVIFDSLEDLMTRGNTKSGTQDPSIALPYNDYINQLYAGKTFVENGEFTIEFTVPKDILYSNGKGKMSFYAFDSDNWYEAQGSFLNYTVGGIDSSGDEENPPVIDKMYLSRADFQSGDIVNSSPLFYAEISDDTGINLSNGIGHNISLTIDGTLNYNLTPYFTSVEGSKKGVIQYLIPELEEGKHWLQFRIWDVCNNSTSDTLQFEVVNNYKPSIYDFSIYGNPARENTRFVFKTDVVGKTIGVRYEVYSITGALQWVHEEQGVADMMSYYEYEWDLTTSSGRRLNAGIYVCRVTISVDGKAKTHKSEKLIVLGQ